MKYIVYQTTNKVNGKIYIGVHKTKDPNVFDGYIGNGLKVGWSLDNPKTLYQRALKKYGYHNFIRTTLFTYDTPQEAYDKEAQLVTFEFIKQDNNYNTRVGGIQGGTNFVNMYQFDYNGNLIKIWDSISEIVEYYSCSSTRFYFAATQKYSAFESYWSYYDSIDISEYRKSKHCETYQYDMNGNLLKVFKSTADAAKKLGYNRQRLNESISKKVPYKGNFYVKDQEFIFDVIKHYYLNKSDSNIIVQKDLNNNIISKFISATEASKELNIERHKIPILIKEHSIINNQYYLEQLNNPNKLKNRKIGQYDFKTKKLIKIWNNITECAKIYPKSRDVLKGGRNHTHGYTFEYISED